jgi:hypothetical protein
MASTINSDNGVVSGSMGLKYSADATGNLVLQTAGNTVVTLDTGLNANFTGTVSAVGNVTGGNVRTAGLITATGNVQSGNILTTGLISSTGNVQSGNILTSGAVSAAGTVNALNTFGFENRIINGGMTIDQRNAGASVTPTSGQYLVDRFSALLTQASKYTAQQNAASVTPPVGFINYLGITSSSAYSVLAGDFFAIVHKIEGLNVADLAWGTASAKTVTLSFQVRSSLTGTFGGNLKNSAGNRSYPFTYSIPTANTWTAISVTIAGDTSGTWLTTNGIGIEVDFGLGVGSTYSGTAGSWSANNYVSATGATSVVGTNAATWYVTGVQLEVGSQATSFDFRDYGRELMLCQRYFQKSISQSVAVGTAVGDIRAFPNIDIPVSIAGQALSLYCWFKTTMRTIPTIAYYDGTGTVSKITGIASSTAQTTGVSLNDVQATDNGVQFRAYDIPYYGFGLYYTATAEL